VDHIRDQSSRVTKRPEVFVPLGAFLYIWPFGAKFGTLESALFSFQKQGVLQTKVKPKNEKF
jgi:hypothetical protein